MTTTTESWTRRTLRHGYPKGVSPRTRTTGLFVLVALAMGGGYVTIRVGVDSVPPLFLASLRFYLTAAVLLSVTAATGRIWWPQTRTDWTAVTVLGVLVFAGAIGFLFVGQQYTTAAGAAIVMCLGPVLTALIARALLPNERLSRRQVAGIVFGLLGAVIIVQPDFTDFELGAEIGAGMVLCAAASGSLGGVLLGRLRTTAILMVQAGWGAVLGGLILHAVSIGLGEPVRAVVWTPALVGVVVYLSVVVGGIGYVAFLALLETVGPTRTSFTSYVSPLVAILIGWMVLHEPLTVGIAGGFGSIVIGFVLLNGVFSHEQ